MNIMVEFDSLLIKYSFVSLFISFRKISIYKHKKFKKLKIIIPSDYLNFYYLLKLISNQCNLMTNKLSFNMTRMEIRYWKLPNLLNYKNNINNKPLKTIGKTWLKIKKISKAKHLSPNQKSYNSKILLLGSPITWL